MLVGGGDRWAAASVNGALGGFKKAAFVSWDGGRVEETAARWSVVRTEGTWERLSGRVGPGQSSTPSTEHGSTARQGHTGRKSKAQRKEAFEGVPR